VRRSLDGLAATFVLGLVVIAGILTALGAVVGLIRGDELRAAVGWSLAVGGAIVALLVGGSGSTSVNHHGSRDVVGTGHFVGARVPLPQTSLVWALVGFVCAGIGILVLVV
jgi:hypothetical protein